MVGALCSDADVRLLDRGQGPLATRCGHARESYAVAMILPTRAAIGALLSAALLLCGSCSPGFGIVASGVDENVTLSLRKLSTVCIYELTVVEEQWPNRRMVEPVWSIKAVNGCVALRKVTIGELPQGFVVERDRLPMQRGHMYGAHGVARFGETSRYRGASLPWFVCRGQVSVVDWKDAYRLRDRPERCAD